MDSKRDPLATNISEDVIAQALQSVERRAPKPVPAAASVVAAGGEAPAATGAQSIAPPAAPAAAAATPAADARAAPKPETSDATAAPAADADEVRKLREALLETRQALRAREAELETSQAMSRDTLEKLRLEHERLLRASADLDNYRKRAVRERDEVAKFGQEKLLKELLPALDNLDRALEHAERGADAAGLATGVRMTRKLFLGALGKHGVTELEALNQPFDPSLHEAMQAVESDSAPGTVVQELARGYQLHGRLLRPAMVAVAKARTAAPETVANQEPAAAPAEPAARPEPSAAGESAKE